MAEKAGFNLYGEFYPWAESIRAVDPVLVTTLTRMKFLDWAEALEDPQTAIQDPVIRLGLMGVAIWQKNPRWPIDRVIKFLEPVTMDEIEFQGGDEDEAEVEPGPLAASPEVGADPSPASSVKSNGSTEPPTEPPASGSQDQIPSVSGSLGSVTGVPA